MLSLIFERLDSLAVDQSINQKKKSKDPSAARDDWYPRAIGTYRIRARHAQKNESHGSAQRRQSLANIYLSCETAPLTSIDPPETHGSPVPGDGGVRGVIRPANAPAVLSIRRSRWTTERRKDCHSIK